jgi:formylglycine-generating enzyme required for sulfatase activity
MASDESGNKPEAHSKAKVFISYSRRDRTFADRLDAALKERGFEPLIDRTDIYAFEEWWKRVEALIAQADTIVFVLSPDAVKSGTVALKEVAFAASLNKRFAPIVFRLVDDKSVPETLAKLNFIFFDDPARFERSADQLAEALNTNIFWIRQHTEYGEAERRWSAAGRPSGLLLRTPTLEVAEHWARSRPPDAPALTREIQAFIVASRQAESSTQRRRQFTQVLIYTLLIGIILGLIGWINQAVIREQWNWATVMRPYMQAQVRPHVLSRSAEQTLQVGDTFKECAKDCPEMIVIPAGQLTMGSPTTEQGHNDDEAPQHRVTIAKPFAVSKFVVTFADWDACAGVGGCPDVSDSNMGRGNKPVVNTTWEDAGQYAAWLSRMSGQPYRLLTEAEWEYAARAGTTTTYYWGNGIGNGNANCDGCAGGWDNQQTSPVGSFKPNAFGLYDMVGNVWQWVQDCYHPNYDGAPMDGSAWISDDCDRRVNRGGSWYSYSRPLRSAARVRGFPGNRDYGLGFRIARDLSSR